MAEIDWSKVNRVLVVRLRSIGDTVLATPSLIALRRFLPGAQIDILLEDWVAPVLAGFDEIDNIITVGTTTRSRIAASWKIRGSKYDVAFNFHGGTTAGFFTRITGAKFRVGFRSYQYGFLYNHPAPSSAEFWGKEKTHSAEQQLALLGGAGVPVNDRPKSRLTVTETARISIAKRLQTSDSQSPIALLHPVAATATKQWETENFARVAEYLSAKGFRVIAVATRKERDVLDKLTAIASAPISVFDDLTLPEITALAAEARIFVGNDSGIAHIAAAVGAPSVVIFGSSNRVHWHPWTNAPHEIVFQEFECQPCAGYFCAEFGEPKCILGIKVESVCRSIDKVLQHTVPIS